MSNISVIGAGYVGLVTATCFADLGHRVRLVEIDKDRVTCLKRGILPIVEEQLPELWQSNWEAGRLSVTSDYKQGLADCEFAFITVGTPSAGNGKAELKWVRSAARSIAEAANGPLIIVLKSTVPVGTADIVTRVIARHCRNGHNFPVVSNPEFLREGVAVYDFMHPDRVVVGAFDQRAADAVAELHEPLDSPIIKCDNRTAEISKYASNVFLATRLSFINEIALLCDEYGIDVVEVAEIVGMDPRFGTGYLSAGLGWGGSCLPKDVKGLIHMAKSRRVSVPLLRAVQQINQNQPHLAIEKLCKQVGSLEGKTIGILGLSFKPNSDDIREARSLLVISILKEHGCQIKAYDPLAMKNTAKLFPDVTYCTDAYEVAASSDALILVTEWDEFKELNMKKMASLMNCPVLIDGRNLYDAEEMAKAGFTYDSIGHHATGLKKLEGVLLGGA
ncbi:MAG: UDP-glucose/GDP-mannose dehydrogenase family protein [Dehalococcoidales bacterium]|nr:MAG: UDP-glucose/GDP-mannose dehydrogenase family protein [Dehalococcoidales bacterium]